MLKKTFAQAGLREAGPREPSRGAERTAWFLRVTRCLGTQSLRTPCRPSHASFVETSFLRMSIIIAHWLLQKYNIYHAYKSILYIYIKIYKPIISIVTMKATQARPTKSQRGLHLHLLGDDGARLCPRAFDGSFVTTLPVSSARF